eukprot:GHVU01022672.1.p1 GENE.GHVU01022672.1~~GHVU01022672.1.p1  ORF type:complete len:240 (+),score=51.55 GHVU01022672.1:29-721(+)
MKKNEGKKIVGSAKRGSVAHPQVKISSKKSKEEKQDGTKAGRWENFTRQKKKAIRRYKRLQEKQTNKEERRTENRQRMDQSIMDLHARVPVVSQYWNSTQQKKAAARDTSKAKEAPLPVVSIDCEMVGTGPEKSNELARVSVVDEHLRVLLDCFVKPQQPVTDYRTHVTGITKKELRDAMPFDACQRKVQLVGRERRRRVGNKLEGERDGERAAAAEWEEREEYHEGGVG